VIEKDNAVILTAASFNEQEPFCACCSEHVNKNVTLSEFWPQDFGEPITLMSNATI